MTRRARLWVGRTLLLLLLALSAMILALAVTPRTSVSVFGQTVQVGAVPPSFTLGLSGPGEAALFGEGTVETVQHFEGPIRPLIVWQKFNRNDDAAAFLRSDSGTDQVGDALAGGWVRYFVTLLVVAATIGGGLYLASVGANVLLRREHVHRSRGRHLTLLAVSVVASLLVTLGFTALTVRTAVTSLGSVDSLADLVGTATVAQVPAASGPTRTDVDAVVIGDSTAAGIGNTPLRSPSAADRACQRSSDAYAGTLQSVTGLSVLNLACSSATIPAGVLGVQLTGGERIAPQFGVLRRVESAKVVVVSIGANDVGWSDFLTLCFGLSRCDDQASDKLFQSRLDAFKVQYAQLLQQLGDLPGHPKVIVVKYYDPLGSTFDCDALSDPRGGFDAAKVVALRSELTRMNDVLEQGAAAFDFPVVQPRFDGHELCTDQPWVQGLADPAPFHPNSAGELAMAAAVLTQFPG